MTIKRVGLLTSTIRKSFNKKGNGKKRNKIYK